MAEIVDEKDFFSINGIIPSNPYLEIQFKVGVQKDNQGDVNFEPIWENVNLRKNNNEYNHGGGLNNLWENVLKHDNYFDSIELSDSGGMIECDLTLYDKDFSNLDSLLQRTVLASKVERREKEKRQQQQAYIQLQSGATQYHFRVRIGYEEDTDTDNIINNSNDFKNRTKKDFKNKITLRSDWMYFKILNFKLNIESDGMVAKINGISIGKSALSNMQYYQSYAGIEGTPENVLKTLIGEMYLSSNAAIIALDESGDLLVSERLLPDDLEKEVESAREEVEEMLSSLEDKEEFKDKIKSEMGVTWDIFGGDEELRENYTVEDEDGNENFDEAQYNLALERDDHKHKIHIRLFNSEPRPIRDDTGEVILDDNNNAKYEISLSNISQLLNNVCRKVPPIFYHPEEDFYVEGGEDVRTIIEDEGDKEGFVELSAGEKNKYKKSDFKPVRYTFSALEEKIGDEVKIFLKFFYRRPEKKQEFFRRYSWRNNQNSIISSLTIDSKMDFANIMGVSFGDEGATIAVGEERDDSDVDDNEPNLKKIEIPRGRGGIAYSSFKEEDEDNTIDDVYKDSVISVTLDKMKTRMKNKGGFSGSIEIPGDPFYRFDNFMQPFSYFIKINVENDTNFYSKKEGRRLSYISGDYALKKINHSISNSGFSTKLEIEKWPTPKEEDE